MMIGGVVGEMGMNDTWHQPGNSDTIIYLSRTRWMKRYYEEASHGDTTSKVYTCTTIPHHPQKGSLWYSWSKRNTFSSSSSSSYLVHQ